MKLNEFKNIFTYKLIMNLARNINYTTECEKL